jgi:hypothetical protein
MRREIDGDRDAIVADILTRSGQSRRFRSIWQVDQEFDLPLFILQCTRLDGRRSRLMSIELFRDVILTTDVPEYGLRAGDVGVAVERHTNRGGEEGYSVEFFDLTGQTVAVVIVRADELRAPTSADRASCRTSDGGHPERVARA